MVNIGKKNKKDQKLLAQQMVFDAHKARLAGEKDYSLDESEELIDNLIEGKE